MSHPKNSTAPNTAQYLLTCEIGFHDAPIDKRRPKIFSVASGIEATDALETARTLSSGLGQICGHLNDSLSAGEMVYCDGIKTLAFIAGTVSTLVWSVQCSLPPAEEGMGDDNS